MFAIRMAGLLAAVCAVAASPIGVVALYTLCFSWLCRAAFYLLLLIISWNVYHHIVHRNESTAAAENSLVVGTWLMYLFNVNFVMLDHFAMPFHFLLDKCLIWPFVTTSWFQPHLSWLLPWQSTYKQLLAALITFYIERFPAVKVEGGDSKQGPSYTDDEWVKVKHKALGQLKMQTPVKHAHAPYRCGTYNDIVRNMLGIAQDKESASSTVKKPPITSLPGFAMPFALNEEDFDLMMREVNNTQAMIPFDLSWLGAFIRFYPPVTHPLVSVVLIPILRWFVGPLSLHLSVIDERTVKAKLAARGNSNINSKSRNTQQQQMKQRSRHLTPSGAHSEGTDTSMGAVSSPPDKTTPVVGIYVHKCKFLKHSREAYGEEKGNELCVKQCALAMEQIWRERVGVETWLEPDLDKGCCRVYAIPHPQGQRYLLEYEEEQGKEKKKGLEERPDDGKAGYTNPARWDGWNPNSPLKGGCADISSLLDW